MAALYLAAAVALLLCWQDVTTVVIRMEHGPVRERLLAVLQPAEAAPEAPVPAPLPPPVEVVVEPPPEAPVVPEHPDWWRPISPEAPLRVWVVGDSLVNMTAPELKRQLEATGLAEVRAESRPNTGLVRDDYYSWPRRFERHLSRDEVDAIVVMIGANDSQNMLVDRKRVDLRTEAWLDEYARRIEALMDLAVASGARVYWAGLPVMRKSRHHLTAEQVNPLIAAASEARPSVRYVSTWELFAGADGGYQYWGLTESGRKVSMRDADGVHFTMSGAIRLADHLRGVLESEWPLAPETDATAEAPDTGLRAAHTATAAGG